MRLIRLLLQGVVVLFGLAITGYGLTRLGFGRHGEVGIAFLHPEWWGELGAHSAHGGNLATVGVGLLIVGVGVWMGWRDLSSVRKQSRG